MNHTRSHTLRLAAWLASGLGLALVIPALAQPPEKLPEPGVRVLSLADAIQLALEKQPGLAAQRASLAAAEDQLKALRRLRVSPASVVAAPDLSFRIEQACIGVGIAEAGLHQAELETAYAVTRLYYTVLYARAQQKVAEEVSVTFGLYHGIVDEAVKKKGAPKEWTTTTVDKLNVYKSLAESKREEATQGIQRAMSALKEAIGTCEEFQVADEPLPEPNVKLNKAEIVAMAQALRGEVIQTSKLAEVFDLEVSAQGRKMFPGQVPTFASAGDIHARLIPAGRSDTEYSPAGIPPEMPPSLIGTRKDRMQRARDFAERASAVADKTRNLIVLEAEDTYFRAVDSQNRMANLREASKAGGRLIEDTPKDFAGLQKVKVEDVLGNLVLGAQGRSGFNEANWQFLLNLAALERVTGGGFCASFTTPAPKEK